MKKIYLIPFLVGYSFAAVSQDLSLNDLLTLTSATEKKTDHILHKKGFRKAWLDSGNENMITYQANTGSKKKSRKRSHQQIQSLKNEKANILIFQTSSSFEYANLKQKIGKEGFTVKPGLDTSNTCFSRGNMMINIETVINEADTVYTFRITEKQLPHPSKIIYAEDLLNFSTHNDLEIVFGKGNVRKDLYYFSEKEILPCTVLFPHSERQSVFIWNNEELTDLNSVLVGGSLRIISEITQRSAVVQNTWSLSTGVRSNMSLKELLNISGEDIQFYGKRSPYFLSIYKTDNKATDINGVEIILGCLNCNDDSVLDAEMVSAKEALKQRLGLFVLMVRVFPKR